MNRNPNHLPLSHACVWHAQFEAWLSFQVVTSKGLKSRKAGREDRSHTRNHIVTVHNANDYLVKSLQEMWSEITPEEAKEVLSRPDVAVTNKSDKEVQLQKLEKFYDEVKQTLSTEELKELDQLAA